MSRISYSDDEEFEGQFALWQANCRRSLEGRKGQAALRELETALVAMPEKRLIRDALEDGPDVCAIGALARHKGVSPTAPEWQMEEVGVECGMPRLVAWKVVELNDIDLDHRWTQEPIDPAEYGTGRINLPVTPEERYAAVLEWVRQELRTTTKEAA